MIAIGDWSTVNLFLDKIVLFMKFTPKVKRLI